MQAATGVGCGSFGSFGSFLALVCMSKIQPKFSRIRSWFTRSRVKTTNSLHKSFNYISIFFIAKVLVLVECCKDLAGYVIKNHSVL